MDKKALFLETMRTELAKHQWAVDDPARLERSLTLVAETMSGSRKCLIDGPSWLAAWRAIGQKGKPTYKALHGLFQA